MRKIFLLLGLLFHFSMVFSQKKVRHIPHYPNGQVNYWYEYDWPLFKELGLGDLDSSQNSYHFRLRTSSHAIEVWRTREGLVGGKYIFWVKENVPEGEPPTNRIHHQEFSMDSLIAKKLLYLIDTSNIEKLNDEGHIAGLEYQETAPASIIIEYSNSSDYYFKVHNPYLKESPQERGKIQGFSFSVLIITNAMKLEAEFDQYIPFESYYVCCPKATTTRNNLSSKQKKQYKKERDDWRKKMK